MESLTGLDARFLYSETPTAPMHTLKIAVLDVSSVPGGLTPETFLTTLEARLALLPPLRRRVVPIPYGLGHPVWVEDPDFDPGRHVTYRRAPAPGGPRELAAVVAELAAAPLPRDRPLWEVTLLDGLEHDHIACIAKVHHAVADGVATVEMLRRALMDRGASEPPPVTRTPLPDRRALRRVARDDRRARLRSLPDFARRSVHGIAATRRGLRRAPRPPRPFDAPRSPLNVSLDAGRTFAMTTLPLDSLLAVRTAFGATLNDAYLAVCGGALRRYLDELGALPPTSLVAAVPLATHAEEGGRFGGNHVDNMWVALRTDLADPAARLRSVHEIAATARAAREALGPELFEERAALTPPHLYSTAVRWWARTGLANRMRPPVNLVASNVRGPREPLQLGGARLEAIYSVGPILEGVGLNLTAWSYLDHLHVAALGCPASLPDPWPLVEHLHDALDELVAAAGVAA